MKLSRERAAAVVAALDARGVDPNALKSIGVGESKATVSEKASDAERQVDRKVVVKAIEDAAEWESIKKRDYEDAPAKKTTTKKKK